ncbi:DNA recombination protein RmuC [candidate division KSB1 bacterium]|nr:MAG: DNA recombination protein RmuC [candidate division KSB1 bacterium]
MHELETLLNQVKDSFGNLSIEVLNKSTKQLVQMADKVLEDRSRLSEEQLTGKKKLIDQTLGNMKEELSKVQNLIQKIENERKQSYGELSTQLKHSVEQTQHLQNITQQLSAALTHTQARGQWGERMAEDVLRMAGFIEGINYLKQSRLQSNDKRPDFTFLLPQNLKVNMDVKFPLTNYLAYLNAETDQEREHYKNLFLRDVRKRIKEVTTRDYINPAENTVDYVIVFIPNEQVYAFINEHDNAILDEALKNKVILSSPITLYAVLAVIRQAVDNFNLERTAAEILSLLNDFNKQWEKFKESMEKMGKRLSDAQKEYNNLITTRTNQLERPLRKIEQVRVEKHLNGIAAPKVLPEKANGEETA